MRQSWLKPEKALPVSVTESSRISGTPAWCPLSAKRVRPQPLTDLHIWLVAQFGGRNVPNTDHIAHAGAGKSTVIKLIIDLLTPEGHMYATPVVGAAGVDIPTSGDVHLYPDPQSAYSQRPILYADCEGLDGGEREPLAGRFRRRRRSWYTGDHRHVQSKLATSEREITWATTNTRRTRSFAVSQMYPRLLYTFSDIVVFVLKNPRYHHISLSSIH